MAKENARRGGETALYREAENQTNRDNVKCLLILAGILLLCELLNEIGVFQVAPLVMRLGAACGALCYLIPVAVLARPIGLFGRNAGQRPCRDWHKSFVLTFAWLGTMVTCILFTHHAVIVMAIPLILAAQYRDNKKLLPVTLVCATVCVLLGVYGGYFWGCFDANLLHTAITDENAFDLALRLELGTPKRMVELLTHYALPREFIVLALVLLADKISLRSGEMLRRQAQLQSAVEQEMQRTNAIQRQVIDGMANLIENRDASTGEHVKRTSFYVKSLVDRLREDSAGQTALSDEDAETIVRAAPLHDIGKIVVADRILQKPGKLTPEEYEEIKLHAAEGAKVIDNVLGSVEDERFLRAAKEIAGGHHERWDGKGYPDGVCGESIPLSARIMAVADVFDALVSKRVYKEPVPPEEAFAILESEAGKQFDPKVVEAFCGMKADILAYLNAAPADGAGEGSVYAG